ncbi:hypothetical protein EON65_38600, partial [archaeon]
MLNTKKHNKQSTSLTDVGNDSCHINYILTLRVWTAFDNASFLATMIGDLIRTASGTISAFKVFIIFYVVLYSCVPNCVAFGQEAIAAIAGDENFMASSDFNRLPELLRWNWDLVPNEDK